MNEPKEFIFSVIDVDGVVPAASLRHVVCGLVILENEVGPRTINAAC